MKDKAARAWLPHAILASIQLCFSGWHIVGVLALRNGADPLIFALYREVLASGLMMLLVYCWGMLPCLLAVHKVYRARFLFLGLCSFGNVVGTVVALQFISATRYALMQPTIPVIASCVTFLSGMEKMNRSKLIGIILSVGGAMLVELWGAGTEDPSNNELVGILLCFLQVCSVALLLVCQKALSDIYPAPVVTAVYYSVGSIYTIIVCICVSFTFVTSDLFFEGRAMPWLGLAYATVFATLYTYNGYSWAVKHVPSTIVTVYSTLQPVFTSLLGVFILSDTVTSAEGVGGALVILGLFCTVYGSSQVDKQAHNFLGSNDGYDVIDQTDSESVGLKRRHDSYTLSQSSVLEPLKQPILDE